MNKNNVDIFDTLSPDDLMIRVDVEDERPRKTLVVYVADEMGNASQRISFLKQLFYSNSTIQTKVFKEEHMYDETGYHIDITDIREEDLIRVISRMMCCYIENTRVFREIKGIKNKTITSRMRLASWSLVKQYNNPEKELVHLALFIYDFYPGNMSYQLIAKRLCQRCRARTHDKKYSDVRTL